MLEPTRLKRARRLEADLRVPVLKSQVRGHGLLPQCLHADHRFDRATGGQRVPEEPLD
jgi:hypothetical protein